MQFTWYEKLKRWIYKDIYLLEHKSYFTKIWMYKWKCQGLSHFIIFSIVYLTTKLLLEMTTFLRTNEICCEQLLWKNFLKLLIFLQNEIFHRMNNFTEQMLCKKMNETFEKKAKSTIFIQSKKRTKWIVYKRLTNEMKKKRNSPL